MKPGGVEEESAPTNARATNLVLESLHDLESTILEACDEPTLLARRFPVSLVPRRVTREPRLSLTTMEVHPFHWE